MNSKTALRNTFKLMNGERPVFIPFVYGLAAKLAQMPLSEMTSDASYYTHSLEDAYELFKYDGIVNTYDSTVEAEIFGFKLEWPEDYSTPQVTDCSRVKLRQVNQDESYRWQILLETTKRLVMTKGKDTAIIGTLTGPCSLVRTLTGEANKNPEEVISLVGNVLKDMVKRLCELRVDAIFFREDILDKDYIGELRIHGKPYIDVYKTLFNLVHFYNSSPAIIVKNMELNAIPQLHGMVQQDTLILLGANIGNDDMVYLGELSDSLKISFGLPLKVESHDELINQFSIYSRHINNRPSGFFYVSEGEIPYDIPLEILHELIAMIRNA